MNFNALATANWWACSIIRAVCSSATAHNAETDLTGENVRS